MIDLPPIEWSGLPVNGWQALATVAIIIVALFVIARFLMRFWPWLKKIIALGDALAQLPVFMADTTATMATQSKKIEDIHHETHHNNGTSLKDAQVRTENAVERIELGVKGLYERADASDKSDAEIRHELEKTKPPSRKRATPKKEQQ